jgi:hypothetical protein
MDLNVLSYMQDRKHPVHTTLGDVFAWALQHASTEKFDFAWAVGKQLWIDQVLRDVCNACKLLENRHLSDVYPHAEDVPFLTWVHVRAYPEFFPRPVLFSHAVLSFFRQEMPDTHTMTLDFDGKDMLWPSMSKDAVEQMFQSSSAAKLQFDTDIVDLDPSETPDDETREERWQRIARQSFGKYHEVEEWTKNGRIRSQLLPLKFANDAAADAADLIFEERCRTKGVQYFAKDSFAAGPVRKLSKEEADAWLLEMAAKEAAIAKFSPFYQGG